MIKNHINLHHSQTVFLITLPIIQIKNHINLHHSQTNEQAEIVVDGLRTILIYIILKRTWMKQVNISD